MITKEELEKYSQNTLENNKVIFDRCKEIANDLMQNTDIEDIDKYKKYLNQLTGFYMTLNPVYKKIRAEKENWESTYYNHLKLQSDVEQIKFVSAVAEKQASEFISPLRLARDILEGYVTAITTAIYTCRSRLYNYDDTKNIEQSV